MASEVIVHRRASSLIAATMADVEAIDALAHGIDYRAILTRAQGRSVKQNRMLWGLAKIVAENLPDQPGSVVLDNEAVVGMLKQEAGFVTPIMLGNGSYKLVPRSVSFEKCDQDTFNAFFNKALAVVERDIIPGLKAEDARREIEAMLADKRAA